MGSEMTFNPNREYYRIEQFRHLPRATEYTDTPVVVYVRSTLIVVKEVVYASRAYSTCMLGG